MWIYDVLAYISKEAQGLLWRSLWDGAFFYSKMFRGKIDIIGRLSWAQKG